MPQAFQIVLETGSAQAWLKKQRRQRSAAWLKRDNRSSVQHALAQETNLADKAKDVRAMLGSSMAPEASIIGSELRVWNQTRFLKAARGVLRPSPTQSQRLAQDVFFINIFGSIRVTGRLEEISTFSPD